MFTGILLWLFVVFSGVAAGAGLYEMRVNVPRWLRRRGSTFRVDAGAMREDDSGRRFWAFVTTGPLTLLTVASCAAAWNPQSDWERWWLAAAALMLVERAGTLGYFIPNALKLLRAEQLPAGKAEAIAVRWARLNYVRVAVSFAAWVVALNALALS